MEIIFGGVSQDEWTVEFDIPHHKPRNIFDTIDSILVNWAISEMPYPDERTIISETFLNADDANKRIYTNSKLTIPLDTFQIGDEVEIVPEEEIEIDYEEGIELFCLKQTIEKPSTLVCIGVNKWLLAVIS